jgi:Family of unknown function (DUF6152)
MPRKHVPVIVAAFLALGVGAPAWSHHSFPATYHVDKLETVEGTVVQFLYRNPHSFIAILAKGKDGQVHRYAVEWGGSAALGRKMVSAATLRAGDKVTITGNPGRVEEDHRIRLQKIVRQSDGWTWGGDFD